MLQHEVDRNQDLLGQIKKLGERETDAAKNLSEQVEVNCALRQNLKGLNRKLEERDTRLNTANQVHTDLHTHLLHLYSGHVSYVMLAYFCNLFPDHQFFEGWDQRAEAEDSKPRLDNFFSSPWKAGTAGTVRFTTQVQTHTENTNLPSSVSCWTAQDKCWPHSSNSFGIIIRKYQEVSQLCQSLQAAQSSCSEHIIKIKVGYTVNHTLVRRAQTEITTCPCPWFRGALF